VFFEGGPVAGQLIGQDSPAVVDQTRVPHVLEDVVEALRAPWKLVEGRSHLGRVGGPPVHPDGEQHDDDDRIAEHRLILACED